MPTVQDVAIAAGVSVTTVSHVFNKTRYVSPELEERVRSAAQRLKYRPNALARSLRTRRSHTIGVIIPDIMNPFYPAFARGVQDAAEAIGCTTILGNSDRDALRERQLLETFDSRQVDGIVFYPSGSDPRVIAVLDHLRAPVVLQGRRLDDARFDSIGNDPATLALPVRHLVELGHRRIGFIVGQSRLDAQPEKVTGYLQVHREFGLVVDPSLMVLGDYSQQSGRALARQLLALPAPPTALLAGNDLMAIGALLAAGELGLHVPWDVSIVGFDDIPQASITTPRLTTTSSPSYDAGQASVAVLARRIAADTSPPIRQFLPYRLVIRDSSGPPPSGHSDAQMPHCHPRPEGAHPSP
ncbi:MAG: LacI family DNA-binding transcriptional regulator [Chloroflexi bacterium]|nr:LacI family DNA-binding transcriptional regulator [Chloroflexota bacterium]